MTTLTEVIQDMITDILLAWEEDQRRLDDDRVYSSINDVIEEVLQEYIR